MDSTNPNDGQELYQKMQHLTKLQGFSCIKGVTYPLECFTKYGEGVGCSQAGSHGPKRKFQRTFICLTMVLTGAVSR